MPFLTPPLSIADRVDNVFLYIFVLSVVFLVFITGLMVYFTVKYSRRRNPKPVDIEGNAWLEATWTLTPLVLFLSMFYFGWTNFAYMRNPPRDAMVIEVTGRQWAWSFKYPNNKRSEELYLALGRPVRLELRSQDVLHGFYIAAFRVKEDVVPGRQNFLWFAPTILGTFDIQCTVMCGVDHSKMLSKAHVLSEDDFRAWYFADEDAPQPGKVPVAAPGAAQ
jgi:cytochrome c oxidase subunit II